MKISMFTQLVMTYPSEFGWSSSPSYSVPSCPSYATHTGHGQLLYISFIPGGPTLLPNCSHFLHAQQYQREDVSSNPNALIDGQVANNRGGFSHPCLKVLHCILYVVGEYFKGLLRLYLFIRAVN